MGVERHRVTPKTCPWSRSEYYATDISKGVVSTQLPPRADYYATDSRYPTYATFGP